MTYISSTNYGLRTRIGSRLIVVLHIFLNVKNGQLNETNKIIAIRKLVFPFYHILTSGSLPVSQANLTREKEQSTLLTFIILIYYSRIVRN